jgi:hypothetical protein
MRVSGWRDDFYRLLRRQTQARETSIRRGSIPRTARAESERPKHATATMMISAGNRSQRHKGDQDHRHRIGRRSSNAQAPFERAGGQAGKDQPRRAEN